MKLQQPQSSVIITVHLAQLRCCDVKQITQNAFTEAKTKINALVSGAVLIYSGTQK